MTEEKKNEGIKEEEQREVRSGEGSVVVVVMVMEGCEVQAICTTLKVFTVNFARDRCSPLHLQLLIRQVRVGLSP